MVTCQLLTPHDIRCLGCRLPQPFHLARIRYPCCASLLSLRLVLARASASDSTLPKASGPVCRIDCHAERRHSRGRQRELRDATSLETASQCCDYTTRHHVSVAAAQSDLLVASARIRR